MSDLSFNVIALDRASKTFLSAAESIDRMVAKLDKLDGKQATATVNIKTDESQKALDSFTNRFTLMTAGIAAASPIAGAAIIGGLGAAFIGVAATAQSSNEKVQQTYKTLWSNVVQDTKAATNVLVPQLVASGNQIGHTFEALQPQMQRAFAAAGPDLRALTNGVTLFATNAMPGVTSAMEHSLPVFHSVEQLASQMGTTVGTSLASLGQNSAAIGASVQSFGQILGSVLTLGISLANDLARVWAASGQDISAAISGVTQVAAGLASGAIPVLSAGLTAVAEILTVVAQVIEPLAPLLGGVGTAALATWGAFKLASVVTAGIEALSARILTMGVAMESGAAKATAAGIAMQGFGTRAATASVGTAAVAESLAGPVGIAVAAATAGFVLLSGTMGSSSDSAQELAGAMDGVAGALQASNGAVNAAVIGAIQSNQEFKNAADSARQFGISQKDLTGAITAGGSSYDSLAAKIQKVIDANHRYTTVAGGSQVDSGLNDTGQAAQDLLNRLQDLIGKFKDQKTIADQSSGSLKDHAVALTHDKAGLDAAADAGLMFGMSQQAAISGLEGVAAASGDASTGLQDVRLKFVQATLGAANAGAAIDSTFSQADKQVTQARNSVATASHGLENASRAIADAQHGEETAARSLTQAQQGVADAQHGVVTAQRSYADAQRSVVEAQRQERDAQVSLNEARQQAVRDLKAMHQQLDDQFTSEASARVRLFDAQTSGLNLGINSSNARQIASGPVTAENEDQVKAAIDLLSAQNSLNSALQNGANLKQDVAAADARGVEGSKGVVAAQQQVVSAQQQVVSSQQQVKDAAYGVEQAQRAVIRAQQGVSDASYAQQRAHQAVRDAQYQQKQASDQLTTANQALNDAVANTSRSLDITTEAGRRNLGQLFSLADAINKQYGPTAAGYNQLIQQTADKFGLTTDQASNLLKKLGEIPPDWKFSMTAVASANFDELNRVYDDKFGGHIGPISPNVAHAFAAGGQIYGPGGPRDDRIPAMLSNREWVMPVDAVDHYGPETMAAIQKRRFPKFAQGGQVDAARINFLFSGAGVGYQSSVNALTAMGFPAPPSLPKYTPPAYGEYTGGGIPNYKPGSGVARWSGEAMAAMGELSIPASFLPAVLRRMAQESGGNPTIVNDWDSNWQKGTPSVGLMQVIGPTFRANAGPHVGTSPFIYGVSVDPVSNIYAGLNYAGRRYSAGHGGYLGGVLYAMNKPGGYATGGQVRLPRPRAYDNGGPLPPGLSTVYNGTGKPENVRTSSQEDQLLQAMRDLRSAVDRAFTRPLEGTLRTERGALFGEFRAMWRDMEHRGGAGRL
ncbi:transglycosylase SLT domain-containing protein [Amycolatopsis sp. NPDC088138]|uniref:transglycosylase SLT domain-containing protein n=1 Tax=Amycolatopsis sp. NPDC088138 TaxID=3363938 RepID=UPI0038124208